MDDAALSLWLQLREQRDWKARSAALMPAIAAAMPRDRPVEVLDLATGAGSNLRYLAERLPTHQRWLLIDRSAALLSEVEGRTRAWAAVRGYAVQPITEEGPGVSAAQEGVGFSPAEQGVGFSSADDVPKAVSRAAPRFTIAGPHLDCLVELRAQDLGTLHDPSIFSGRHLVTASALLDLVSEAWLRTLASHCRAVGAAALFTITYDGRSSCVPAEPEDERVRGLLNEHQRRDKGLGGPAEGPEAAASAVRCFVEEGYRVESDASDWVLGPADAAMQRTLIDGWARAASEAAPSEAETIASWRRRRLAHVDTGSSHLVVGHRDVAAWGE